jgi:hypothetical protein
MAASREPTDEQRRLVRALAGFGVPQDDIAKHLDIDPKTLRKHFRSDLDRGALEANAKVAQSLFQMATQGQNVAAAIFWMKVRGGWSEKLRPDPPGVEGAPKKFTIVIGSPREEDPELIGE